MRSIAGRALCGNSGRPETSQVESSHLGHGVCDTSPCSTLLPPVIQQPGPGARCAIGSSFLCPTLELGTLFDLISFLVPGVRPTWLLERRCNAVCMGLTLLLPHACLVHWSTGKTTLNPGGSLIRLLAWWCMEVEFKLFSPSTYYSRYVHLYFMLSGVLGESHSTPLTLPSQTLRYTICKF
jgi:hypothetical protein